MKTLLYACLILFVLLAISSGVIFWKYQDYIIEYFKDDYFTNEKVLELCNAGHDGDIKKIDQLLADGVDVNHMGKDNVTPLYWVLISKRKTEKTKEGFKYLLEKGADPTIIVSKGRRTVLNFAAMYNDPSYLRIILEQGVDDIDLERVINIRETPLLSAKISGRFRNFKMLLDYGANIEWQDQFKETPFIKSLGNGTWKFAYELLQRGAKYTSSTNGDENSDVNSAMENLVYRPSVALGYDQKIDYRQKCVQFLREKGVEVNPYMPEDEKYITENEEDILYINESDKWVKYTDSELRKEQQKKKRSIKYKISNWIYNKFSD